MTLAPPTARSGGEAAVRDGSWLLAGAFGLVDERGEPVRGPVELVVRSGVIELSYMGGEGSGDELASGGLVLVPLLVNAHDHGRGAGNVLAGIADAPLETWIASLRAHGGASQVALVRDGCRMMLESGVGATVICVNPQGSDTEAELAAAASAIAALGVRAAVVYPFADAMGNLDGRGRDEVGWSEAEVDRHLRAVEALAARIEDARVEVQLGPVGPQWVSEPTLRAVAAHARHTGRRVHMHLLESRAQRAWADATYPDGLIDFLDRVDLLGPHVCFAHGTQLRPDELAALAGRGCVLALNASSNLRLCSGIAPVAEAMRSTVDVGAGLDGLALGDDGDFFNELRLLRGLCQAQSGQPLDAEAMLDRTLRAGRRALGSAAPDEPGPGQIADFVLLDLGGYEHLLDRREWSVADLVLAAGRPERISEVWVGGQRAYEGVASRRAPGGAVPAGRRHDAAAEGGRLPELRGER